MLAVSLKRLSTNKQVYGFGVQTKEINDFCNNNGITIVKDYEVRESGGNDNSDVLWEAVDLCKKLKAKLIVSRACRLTRSMSCLQKILSSGVDVVVVQFGLNASHLLLNLMTSINSYEKDTISLRIKAALAERKRRQLIDPTLTPIGNPNIAEARLKANQACRAKGQATKERFIGLIIAYRLQGLSANAIAKEFNKVGLKAPRGGKWRHSSIRALENR